MKGQRQAHAKAAKRHGTTIAPENPSRTNCRQPQGPWIARQSIRGMDDSRFANACAYHVYLFSSPQQAHYLSSTHPCLSIIIHPDLLGQQTPPTMEFKVLFTMLGLFSTLISMATAQDVCAPLCCYNDYGICACIAPGSF